VLLAQNRFADFLKATPKARNEVLKGVFGYERFDAAHEVARSRVGAATAALEALGAERERLAQAKGRLAEARARLEAATERATRLGEAREAIDTAQLALREASDREAEAGRTIDAITTVADAIGSVPVEERL
jgi:exonuclease SbcC